MLHSGAGICPSALTIEQPVLLPPLLQLRHHHARDDVVGHQETPLQVLLSQDSSFCSRQEGKTQK